MTNSDSETTENTEVENSSLQVVTDDVEIGKTYPIVGYITNFLEVTEDQVAVEIGFSTKNPSHKITAFMTIPSLEKIELLKQRAFEPGIFVSTVLSKEPKIVVNCSTVLFGKNSAAAQA